MNIGSDDGPDGFGSLKPGHDDLFANRLSGSSGISAGILDATGRPAVLIPAANPSPAVTARREYPKHVRRGQRVGEWVLEERIERSEHSEVWRARHSLWRDLHGAAKIATDPSAAMLLSVEGRALYSLNSPDTHPNIAIPLAGSDTSRPAYLITKWVDAPTLRKLIPPSGLPVVQAVTIARQILEGLSHAHDRSVLHHDIKPENILIDDNRFVTLIDFGAGKAVGTVRSLQPWLSTQANPTLSIRRTLAYMSPEERLGQPGDERSDLHQFGSVWFEMLTGELPDGNHERPCCLRPELDALCDEIYIKATCGRHRRAESAVELLELLQHFDGIVGTGESSLTCENAVQRKPVASRTAPESDRGPRGECSQARQPARLSGRAMTSDRQQVSHAAEALVVSQRGEGAFSSISEAVKAARPGTRILVRAGRYYEALVIDKDLEIVGEGPRPDIIVQSRDAACIMMRSGVASVRGITLRFRVRAACGDTLRATMAVQVHRGELGLENCDVSSDSLACVAVHGHAANAHIRGCHIRGASIGLIFSEQAVGLVEDCQILDHTRIGVGIESDADPLIRRCQIHDGGGAGVEVAGGGRGRVEDCHIFGNETGLCIRGEHSNPTVRNTQVSNNDKDGVSILDHADGNVEDCQIRSNKLSGVSITSGSNPYIRRCRIQRGRIGVLVRGNGEGRVEGCEIRENTEVGIRINDSAAPIIDGCRIKKNTEVGIEVTSRRIPTVSNCNLSGNAGGPWQIEKGSRVWQSGNTVSFWG